ncbi:uncharacterized protein LOC142907109 [Petromyzon marinus]|uniref:uncharacterized protein LOC142907109 n=1 Tax=Petromyzon marinus TaxID=7757 RepID=UPI003F6F97A2
MSRMLPRLALLMTLLLGEAGAQQQLESCRPGTEPNSLQCFTFPAVVPGGVLRLVVFGPALPPLGTETFRAADLSVLQRLDLSFNNISWAPADAFAPLHALLSLELNNNRLTALPAGVFSNLSHLRVLDISSNLVESIAPGAFSGLVSLRLLNLSRNALAALASLARPAGVLPAGGGGGRDAVTVAVAAAALGTTPGPEATMIGPFTGSPWMWC